MDFYLRSENQESMDAALLAAGVLVEQGEELALADPARVALDRIGQDPSRPDTGEVLDGYHANVRVHGLEITEEQSDALSPVVIPTPNSPIRMWA